MIGHLTGTHINGIIHTQGGVGYRIHTPNVLENNQEVSLIVHTQVSDTAITLYAFEDDESLSLFEVLLKQSGIGPKTALEVLRRNSNNQVAQTLAGISDQPLKGLSKTLHDKLGKVKLPPNLTPLLTETLNPQASRDSDVLATLTSLGWTQERANAALEAAKETLGETYGEADDETVLRTALKG
jgi:Holliday junction DNA helicase RuvA